MTAPAPQCQPRIAEVLRLLQASSCFRPGSACGSLPCACAESLAALLTPAQPADRIEELEAALRKSNDALSDWLAFAEEELGEFDLEECEFFEAPEALCHKCQSAGCINLKIRNTRAALQSEKTT